MKKFLLLSTIFVAGTAFAFSGLVDGITGNKSHNYHGVNAIGVHINGDTPDSQEESCSAEKQCGDTCCGAGNVCVNGNECCFGNSIDDYNEELCCDASESTGYAWMEGWQYGNICCPNNRTITSIENVPVCCSENEFAFINSYDPDGINDGAHIHGACCDNGHIVVLADGSEEEGWYEKKCCPAGSTGWAINPETGEIGCCESGTAPVEDVKGAERYCCPEGSTAYDQFDGNCI